MPTSEEPARISRAEIARHAGVGRAAVSNWESRHEDFPRPARIDGRETFDVDAMATWFDGRLIPANMLRKGEHEGLDYGSRFRRSLGRRSPAEERIRPPSFELFHAPRELNIRVDPGLLGNLRASSSPAGLSWLASLLYLEANQPAMWSSMVDLARSEADWAGIGNAWRAFGAEDRILSRVPAPDFRVEFTAAPADVVRSVSTREKGLPAADVLRQLVEDYSRSQGRLAGQLCTPRTVATMAVAALADVVPERPRIHDPYCRAGEFLDEAVTQLSRDDGRPEIVTGHNPDAVGGLAEMNLWLRGVEPAIDRSFWWENPDSRQFDLIVTNPPFNMRLPDEVIQRHPWRYGRPPPHNGNFAWLQYVVSRLSPRGRAAVVMSNNAGVSSNVREAEIRAAMIEDGVVECVITLPPNLFPGTGIPVSLWLLRAPAGRPLDTLFVDATELGTEVSRALRTLRPDAVDRIVEVLRRWRTGVGVDEPGLARSVPVTALREKNHVLSPGVHIRAVPSGPEHRDVTELSWVASALHERLRPVTWDVLELPDLSLAPDVPVVPLGALCELRVGLGGSRVRGDIQRADGIPVVLPKHLRSGRIAERPSTGLPPERVRAMGGYLLQPDDLLLSRTAERGRVARVSSEESGWIPSTGLIRIRIKDARLTPVYLTHLLLSEAVHSWMGRHTAGTVVPAITLTALAELPVVMVPLDEQGRLSAALEAVLEQERLHEQLAATTRKMREALARSLFAVPEV
ncbi:hypothetical protein GCM10009828_057050 [Actinoplanes couchii]|uniref:Site-specific DNA-methyltransferase (adenine-specific) n=2 Tax=Actinoplanes couchii TaxID=403638 RepID=A0ABQ3X128_9ACTN|nr:hypothetical protein Aco03nite_006350 [Actinoplanes couchii]